LRKTVLDGYSITNIDIMFSLFLSLLSLLL